MRPGLYSAGLLLCAAWLLLAVAPANLRVCVQVSGEVRLGFDCPCDVCGTEEVAACGPDASGCCDEDGPQARLSKFCCTCQNLPVMIAAAGPKVGSPQLTAVAPNMHGAALDLRSALDPRAFELYVLTKPPPLQHATVILRL